MLNDADRWPVSCPNCGYEISEEIGRLKTTDRLTCPRCRSELLFDRERFRSGLEDLKRSVGNAMRNAKLAEKL